MPAVCDLPVSLDAERMRSAVRMRFRRNPHTEALLNKLLALVEGGGLVRPAVAWEAHPVVGMGRNGVHLGKDDVLGGPLLASHLALSREIAVMVCTIGPGLEERVAEHFARGKPLHGLMLDEIGNAVLRSLTAEAARLVGREASSRRWGAGRPLSPGMPGWAIEEQRRLFALAGAGRIGVSLTSSGMMTPRKSVSLVVGFGPEMEPGEHAETCSCCQMKSGCAYTVA